MAVLRKLLSRRAIGFIALVVLAVAAPVAAQGDGSDLDVSFESISLPENTELSEQVTRLTSAGGANRFVAINADVLMDDLQAAESVTLNLFDDVAFQLSVTDSGDGVVGSRFWSAENSSAVASFTELNGTLVGRVTDLENNVLYRIVGVDGSVHMVAEDSIDYPPELEIPTPEAPEGEAGASSNDAAGDITANAGPQVDVLAWYDDGALGIFGSAPNAEAAIAAAYNQFNDSADASGALAMLNVVELEYVSWTPPSSPVDAIVAIRSQTDGILDQIHTARDAVGADLVAVIGNMSGGCGIAYVPQSVPREDLGFSYTDGACVGGNLTLVHETAHNFGASHDIGASQPGPGIYSYSQGYVNQTLGYRTIMSYTTACTGCLRVPFFSNPTANYNGNPLGDPGKDNARTLTETAAGVAAYRTSGDTTAPDGSILQPTQGAAVNGDPIELSGTASDNVGVTRVRLTIYETGGYDTWNGSAFTPAFSTVEAVVDAPGNPLSAWSYDLSGAPDGQVVFTAVAFDAVGNFDATPNWRLFNVANDSQDPDAMIDSPASGATVSGEQILLEGTAVDNVDISRVRLTIYDTNGFNTWDGEEFTPTFSTVDADLISDGGFANWTYAMNGPADANVVFTALAYDTAGNTDPTKPWRVFTINSNADTIDPDAVIDNPTQGEGVVDPTVVLDGTATDNVGVTRVRLTIYNTANNHTWDGAAFTSDYSTVEATVTDNGSNTTWSYDMVNPPIETQVVFTALAYDAAGNTDPSRPWRLFEVLAS